MDTELMFSSKSDEYATPQDTYDALNDEFFFTLDPCASYLTTKCDKWLGHEFDFNEYDEEFVDGLAVDWRGETVFCNPPYSKIKDWVKKCREEGAKSKTIVVMLIPARTDTIYFHDYIWDLERNKPRQGVEVRFLKGRLKFGGMKTPAPFPSMLVIFWR